MTSIDLPIMGRLISPQQKRIIVDAPRSLFFYVGRQRRGFIPDTPKARRWAVEKHGATHFDCFTVHRFNLDKTPSAYKVGDFYCRINIRNFQNGDNKDIIEFIASTLTFSFRVPDPSRFKLIYLGKQTLGLIISASAFGIDYGGEILPHLYTAFHEMMMASAAEHYSGRFDVQYTGRMDAENKRICADTYAVPFLIGDLASFPGASLDNLARTPRSAPEAKWNQTIDPEISRELRMTALHAWRQKASQVTNSRWSKSTKITISTDSPADSSACTSNHTASKMKCTRKLVAWISRENLFEFCRRDALRATSGSEHLHGKFGNGGGVADALDMLVRHDYIRECPSPHIDYACRRPSPWYEVNPGLYSALHPSPERHNEVPMPDRVFGKNLYGSA